MIPFSLAAKPEPVTVIELPGSPTFPLSEMVGEMENGTFSGGLADTSIKWVPDGDGGTLRVLVQEPWESAEGEATTVTPNFMEMPGWLALKPCPSTVTKEPGAPVAWDSETVGVTVNPVSLGWPVAPAARMLRRPPGAGGGEGLLPRLPVNQMR